MSELMRSEWIKLRTVVVHWVLTVIAVAFPIVVTTLAAIFGQFSDTDLASDFSGLIAGLAVVTAMLLGAMSATSLTSEYSHNTIRMTFAATPNRVRVHIAKLTVLIGAVLVVALATVAVSWLLGRGIFALRDLSFPVASGRDLTRLVSVAVLAALVAGFGHGLGLVIRNAPATITILLLWPLIIENLVAGLFTVSGAEGAVKWLPYSAAIAAAVDDGGGGIDALGRPWGLIWFGAVVVAIVAAGLALEQRRDA